MAVEQPSFREGMRQSTGGYEMVLSVVLLTFVGLWLDRRFDLAPILTITFAFLAMIGSVANTFYRYQRAMDELDAQRRGAPEAGTDAGTSEPGTPEAGTPEAGTPEAGTP